MVSINPGLYETKPAQAEAQFPGWLSRLMTHPIHGLDRHAELMHTLTEARGAIKVYCEVAPLQRARGAWSWPLRPAWRGKGLFEVCDVTQEGPASLSLPVPPPRTLTYHPFRGYPPPHF